MPWAEGELRRDPVQVPLDPFDAEVVRVLGLGTAAARPPGDGDGGGVSLGAPPPFASAGVEDPSGEYDAPEISGEFAVVEAGAPGEAVPGNEVSAPRDAPGDVASPEGRAEGGGPVGPEGAGRPGPLEAPGDGGGPTCRHPEGAGPPPAGGEPPAAGEEGAGEPGPDVVVQAALSAEATLVVEAPAEAGPILFIPKLTRDGSPEDEEIQDEDMDRWSSAPADDGAAPPAGSALEAETGAAVDTAVAVGPEEAPVDGLDRGVEGAADGEVVDPAAQEAVAPAETAEDLDGAVEVLDDDVVQEADAAALAQGDAPSPRPPAPPEPRRRKHWTDTVFGDAYRNLEPEEAASIAEHDATFIVESLGLAPGSRVLDVGAGAGYLALALGGMGMDVVGVDNSLSQVLRASDALARRPELADKVSFVHGDMRNLPIDDRFDAVVCIGTTFGYFEEEQNRQVLEHLRDHVRPGGGLVLQVINRDHLVSRLPVRSWWQGRGCMVLDEAEMNFFANRLRVHRTVVFEDGRQYEHYMFIRAYTLHDLGKLVTSTGLAVREVSGSRHTRGRFFGATSPDIWIVAKRPE